MSLAALLAVGDHELISLVGGGGKSTLLFGLGDELAAAGNRVLLTTTTKMGRYQTAVVPTVCWSTDSLSATAEDAVAALDRPGPVMLVTGGDDHKVTGPPPERVDKLFAESGADYIIVEADGSHGRPLKAPAAHEPVVPSTSTIVVMLVGIDAVGRPLDAVTHRTETAMRFIGVDSGHIMTPADCAAVLLHPDGALRSCPLDSRVIVAVTKVRSPTDRMAAQELAETVTGMMGSITVVEIPEGL